MSIGGRFQLVRALILGGLRKDGKTRIFRGRLDDDPVTKVKLFLWQILRLCAIILDDQPGMPGKMALLVSQYKTHEGLKRSAFPMLLFLEFVLTANEREKLKRQKPF